ncbi:DNA-directed RNA polymerase subunit omega [Clostridiaceae bacterium HSG29]|nr:DNA-directed RNA polymerase subunit omega [Clostridiaceae bacterium HSG29]
MVNPSVDDLLKIIDSRYEIIVGAAKRARELYEGKETTYDKNEMKAVTIAIKEINEGTIELISPVLDEDENEE